MIDILKLRKLQQKGDDKVAAPQPAPEPEVPVEIEKTSADIAIESPEPEAEPELKLEPEPVETPEAVQEQAPLKSIQELLAEKKLEKGSVTDDIANTADSEADKSASLQQESVGESAASESETTPAPSKPAPTHQRGFSDEEAETESTIDLVTFKLLDRAFGVDIHAVQEVVRVADITRVPNVDNYILGVTNLRGNITPVISLHRRFSLGAHAVTEDTRIIIIQISTRIVGFLVDAVTQILHVTEHSIEPPPEMVTGVDSKYIKGVIKKDTDESLGLLVLLEPGEVVKHASAQANLGE